MGDLFFSKVLIAIEAIPFSSSTWIVMFVLGFFVWLFAKADGDKSSPLNWEHLMIDEETSRASPYKLGYLIGLIVSTWLVITMESTGALTFDIFGTYLTYLLGGAGWNSFVKSKQYLNSRPPDQNDNKRDENQPDSSAK